MYNCVYIYIYICECYTCHFFETVFGWVVRCENRISHRDSNVIFVTRSRGGGGGGGTREHYYVRRIIPRTTSNNSIRFMITTTTMVGWMVDVSRVGVVVDPLDGTKSFTAGDNRCRFRPDYRVGRWSTRIWSDWETLWLPSSKRRRQ